MVDDFIVECRALFLFVVAHEMAVRTKIAISDVQLPAFGRNIARAIRDGGRATAASDDATLAKGQSWGEQGEQTDESAKDSVYERGRRARNSHVGSGIGGLV